jgi:TM2 domain-containing membrane protein YozV
MYCTNCGKSIDDKAVICVNCGVATKNATANSPIIGGNVVIDGVQRYDWLTTLLLCFFLGGLGIHSFYTKKTGIGVAQLLTLGGCGIWALIDLIMIITEGYRDGNGNPLVRR